MRRERTCRVWPDDVRYHRHSQRVNNLNGISTYMSGIYKNSPVPKKRNPTLSFLRALFSYHQTFQSFWTGASHSTARCQRVWQLFSPFLADLAASFSTDRSKRLLGVFMLKEFFNWFCEFRRKTLIFVTDVTHVTRSFI